MITRVLAALVLLLALVPSGARAELLWSRSFESAALGGPMKYSVYLPSGYHDPRRDKELFPTVYLLHGVGDNERAWAAFGQVEATMDRLIASDEIPPFVIVMPAGKKSWFVDSADINGVGDYATAVRDDLRAHVEAAYRVIPERRGRFVAGLSMGGYGALRLGFERPDIYRAIGAMSSALWLRVTPDWVPSRPERLKRIFDGSFGEPFDPSRFVALHPRAYLDRLKAFDGPLGIYLMAGDDDRFGAHLSTVELYRELRDRAIPAELRIVNGPHQWPTWRDGLAPMMGWFAGVMATDGG
ncbi:MAG: hypothetical protein HQ481_16420 [Alphaproteobacteria bacterium]|nr:hypothetical protein [Alphaproteobacteria bacterium]